MRTKIKTEKMLIVDVFNLFRIFSILWHKILTLMMLICSSRSGMDDENDIEAIYNQERERETAAAGGECSNGAADDEQASSRQLSAKIKAYLEKCNATRSQNNYNDNAGSGTLKISDTVKNLKQQMLDAPGLHGGTLSISADVSCFKLSSEAWGVPPFEKSVFGQRKNLSFSFDPATMACGCCPDRHAVLDTVRGGASVPKVFVLADQSFPGGLAVPVSAGCVSIVREEYGSPDSLAELFIELTRGYCIPTGSVVLISSLSHLADTGLAAYTEDLNLAVHKLNRVFRGGLVVLPGIIFPPGSMADGVLIREMAALLSWSADVAKLTSEGGPVLNGCFFELRDHLRCLGAGDGQAVSGVRYRLPRLLGTFERKKWDSGGLTGWKDSVEPLPTATVIGIINTMLKELHEKIGIPLTRVAGLNGAASVQRKKIAVLVGASHMRRLEPVLDSKGYTVKLVMTDVTWRATSKLVADLLVSIREATDGESVEDVVIVLGVLDNTFFKARFEDGEAIPICKRLDGTYHVDGDIICAPLETSKAALLQLLPLMKALPEHDKLLLTPIPRYLWSSCCEDPTHAPNISSDEHLVTMLADLEATTRSWRGICFREKLRNTKLCNVAGAVADKQFWGIDPVHPLRAGYEVIADYLVKGLTSMEQKRTLSNEEMLEVDSSKRMLQGEVVFPPAKRHQWATGNDDFVSRQANSWDLSGGSRGGRGGRGGWGGRGRGFGGFSRGFGGGRGGGY
jgi:uncharacterized membrane protein YgcG